MKHIFGIFKKNSQPQIFYANSQRQAKHIRDQYVNDKSVTLTPIINLGNPTRKLPLVFSRGSILKEVKEDDK